MSRIWCKGQNQLSHLLQIASAKAAANSYSSPSKSTWKMSPASKATWLATLLVSFFKRCHGKWPVYRKKCHV